MRIQALGHVTITADDGTPIPIPQRKLRQLICVLAISGEPSPTDELQDLLWEESGSRSMRSALTTTVTKARHLLPDDVLIHDDDGYRLNLLDGDYLDVREFTRLTGQARSVREADPGSAADLYHAALALWGGQRLPDLPDTEAARTRARRLLMDRRDAIEALAEARLALGHHAAVAADLPAYLAEDPTNEHLWAPLITALARDGRKADALRAYEQARTTMLTETGAEPSEILTGLHGRIAGGHPGITWVPALPLKQARAAAAGVDISSPSTARMYDYLLGGSDYFPADIEAARQLADAVPGLVEMVAANRRFAVEATRVAADAGIRQFVDLGTGIPTSPNVHEIAQKTDLSAHVVYVDNDPWVNAHNRAWRAAHPGVACINADIRQPEQVLSHPDLRALIDPHQPVCVLMVSVLHFCHNAPEIVQEFKAWMAEGSFLAVAHGTNEGLGEGEQDDIRGAYKQSTSNLHMRPQKDILALFDGLELLEPGLVETAQWRNPSGLSFHAKGLAAVGRKA